MREFLPFVFQEVPGFNGVMKDSKILGKSLRKKY